MPDRSEPQLVTRFLDLRAAKVDVTEDRVLNGYPIVFNSLSQDLGGWRERIAPEAVDRTLREGTNVDALLDHRRETTTILGSSDTGLLRMTKERSGLKIRITPPDTTWVRDLMTVVRAGLVKGMSFAFRPMPEGTDWDEEDGMLVRTVHDMKFSEVSIVVNPAYLDTSISARTAAEDKRALEEYLSVARGARRSLVHRERLLRARGIA
mgnify:CR=1 FL=1